MDSFTSPPTFPTGRAQEPSVGTKKTQKGHEASPVSIWCQADAYFPLTLLCRHYLHSRFLIPPGGSAKWHLWTWFTVGLGWVCPICATHQLNTNPWGTCTRTSGSHSLRGKPDSVASKQRNRDEWRKENWEEVGAEEVTLGMVQRHWQKCHNGTVPEDLGAGLVFTAFSSRGRGWKKVYTKSHWNKISKQGRSSVRQWPSKKGRRLFQIKTDL